MLSISQLSLAGQPLHIEEGSGVMPILDLFWRLCKMFILNIICTCCVCGCGHSARTREQIQLSAYLCCGYHCYALTVKMEC